MFGTGRVEVNKSLIYIKKFHVLLKGTSVVIYIPEGLLRAVILDHHSLSNSHYNKEYNRFLHFMNMV